MEELVEELVEEGWLKTPRIIDAFRAIDRADFVPMDVKGFANVNEVLPIGHEQTISQPAVVAFMLEQLQPREGENILDLGSGSGWTTALLAQIVGGDGHVVGVELIKELAVFGQENIAKYPCGKTKIAEIHQGDATLGYPSRAPYDKILISASLPTKTIPQPLLEQLKTDGTIVTPIRNSIWTLHKTSEEQFSATEHPGFVFVPFILPKPNDSADWRRNEDL